MCKVPKITSLQYLKKRKDEVEFLHTHKYQTLQQDNTINFEAMTSHAQSK